MEGATTAQHSSGSTAHRRPHPGLYRPKNTRIVARNSLQKYQHPVLIHLRTHKSAPCCDSHQLPGVEGSKALAWAPCSRHTFRGQDRCRLMLTQRLGRLAWSMTEALSAADKRYPSWSSGRASSRRRPGAQSLQSLHGAACSHCKARRDVLHLKSSKDQYGVSCEPGISHEPAQEWARTCEPAEMEGAMQPKRVGGTSCCGLP